MEHILNKDRQRAVAELEELYLEIELATKGLELLPD
mgnify:CR=1 FL=1